MSKKKNYKYYSEIINKIQKTRSKNNKNWMDLLRLAFKENPQDAKKIVKGIFKEDKRISKLIKQLTLN
jgi:hypothetical protein|tara:strand:+ start:917 stop:1120 length:204 start_codon:yes stop_codon:yes gene_type:complete